MSDILKPQHKVPVPDPLAVPKPDRVTFLNAQDVPDRRYEHKRNDTQSTPRGSK